MRASALAALLALVGAAIPLPAVGSAPVGTGSTAYADVTAYGAKGDGVADDTAAFRAAASTGKALWLPRPPAHYRLSGTVWMRNGLQGDGSMPVVRMYGATGDRAHVMFFMDGAVGTAAEPVRVNGVSLDGGWDGATRPAGEWAHLLVVKRSQHVEIHGNTLMYPVGDCIYVGNHVPPLGVSSHVDIHDNILYRPFRAAIGVISGTDGSIRRNEITKLNAYVNAIDFEPNGNAVDHFRRWRVEGNWFNSPLRGAISGNVTDASSPESGDLLIADNRGVWPAADGGLWHTVRRSRPISNVRLSNNRVHAPPPAPSGAR